MFLYRVSGTKVPPLIEILVGILLKVQLKEVRTPCILTFKISPEFLCLLRKWRTIYP